MYWHCSYTDLMSRTLHVQTWCPEPYMYWHCSYTDLSRTLHVQTWCPETLHKQTSGPAPSMYRPEVQNPTCTDIVVIQTWCPESCMYRHEVLNPVCTDMRSRTLHKQTSGPAPSMYRPEVQNSTCTDIVVIQTWGPESREVLVELQRGVVVLAHQLPLLRAVYIEEPAAQVLTPVTRVVPNHRLSLILREQQLVTTTPNLSPAGRTCWNTHGTLNLSACWNTHGTPNLSPAGWACWNTHGTLNIYQIVIILTKISKLHLKAPLC